MVDKVDCGECLLVDKGCKIRDPRNVQGAPQSGAFCRHYTCEDGRKQAKNLWLKFRDKPETLEIKEHSVDGKKIQLTPFNTMKKHGNATNYQRFLDNDGNIYSMGLDGEIHSTGVNCFITNDIL